MSCERGNVHQVSSYNLYRDASRVEGRLTHGVQSDRHDVLCICGTRSVQCNSSAAHACAHLCFNIRCTQAEGKVARRYSLLPLRCDLYRL